MKRPLPTLAEVAEILGRRRTRPQHRPPPTAGRQLAPLVKSLDARFGQGPGALQARWAEIVGAELARRTEPVRLVKPRGPGAKGQAAALELRVAPGAALLVQHQGPDLITRVNLFLGPGSVDRLRIVQGPVKPRLVAETPAVAAKRRRSAGPLSAGAEAELAAAVSDVKNERLRAALLRLGRGVKRDG